MDRDSRTCTGRRISLLGHLAQLARAGLLNLVWGCSCLRMGRWAPKPLPRPCGERASCPVGCFDSGVLIVGFILLPTDRLLWLDPLLAALIAV
ncbi:hypothetical protein [Komagataeibacter saccharivorans]|uniref:hypothetical protein n=1 Tax=Komagataeibacter saccharivorans TaxID=265959 RepID=UPI002155D9D3|nr:hypothetical protein [Komagataeibacter saccharivorans]